MKRHSHWNIILNPIKPIQLIRRVLGYLGASLVAQLVKNPSAIQETPVWFLGQEDLLEKGEATHSSILAWRILWTVQSMGSQRVGQDWVTFTFTLGYLETFEHAIQFQSPQ